MLLTLVLVLLGSGFGIGLQPARPAAAAPPGFAHRCGIHFCIDGQPFFFAGANTYDVFTYGDGSSTATVADIETRFMDKARIDAHFARLQADKVTVLRLWMFSHETWHGFEPQKGVYSEAQFMLFDYIIESAKAHNVMLIPVFENYWEAYGGIDTRLAWEGITGGHPGRWRFFNKTICPGCFTSYKNYVSHALNRVNHYSGVAYKDEPTIFAWELMNEPRYQDATPNENSTGTTLRAWVDEMGQFIKSIDPNHMLGTGLEAHEARYGFGGDEGNPFIFIHQSPYIDFTSAHPYPTEPWANLSIAQTRALVRAWINDSHNVVGKPFYLGEFNTHTGVRTEWWSAIFNEMEINGGDGTGFWWYQDRNVDGKFGVSQGAPELAVFRQHSDNMAAMSAPRPTRTPTPPPDPTKILKIQYRAQNSLPNDSEVGATLSIVNTGVGLQYVPLSELKVRYWYTTDTAVADQNSCLWAALPGSCGSISGTIVTLNPPRPNADRYLELSFSAAAGSLAPFAGTGDIQNRINKSDWSPINETNDYSFDATKTSYADWNRVTLYRNGMLVWGVEPGGTVTPVTSTPTRTPTRTAGPSFTPTRTSGPSLTPTRTTGPSLTPTRTAGPSLTPTRTVGPSATPTRTTGPSLTPTRTGGPSLTPTRTTGPTLTPTRTTGPTSTPTRTPVVGGCVVTYTVNDWNNGAGGFTGSVTITNNGAAAINGWTLAWTFANQRLDHGWEATLTQPGGAGTAVTAVNLGHNGSIGPNGGSRSFGFNATYFGSNPRPATFTLNGTACAAP